MAVALIMAVFVVAFAISAGLCLAFTIRGMLKSEWIMEEIA